MIYVWRRDHRPFSANPVCARDCVRLGTHSYISRIILNLVVYGRLYNIKYYFINVPVYAYTKSTRSVNGAGEKYKTKRYNPTRA